MGMADAESPDRPLCGSCCQASSYRLAPDRLEMSEIAIRFHSALISALGKEFWGRRGLPKGPQPPGELCRNDGSHPRPK